MITRRKVLAGIGASLALPHFDSIAAAQVGSSKVSAQKFVGIGIFFGMNPDWFFPESGQETFVMPDLLNSLTPHQDDLTIFSQLDHPGIKAGHNSTHTFLSGVRYDMASSMPDGNLTVDQRIAEELGGSTRFRSLQYGIAPHSSSYLSWTRHAVPLRPEQSIERAFDRLFLNENAAEKAEAKARLNQGKSVLDLVNDQAKQLQKRLGKRDRDKLDEYFTSVRTLEKDLNQTLAWGDKEKPKVDYQKPSPPSTFVQKVPLFYDLIALAMQTDSTRAITFDITDFGGASGIAGIDSGYHTLTHHGKMEGRLSQLRKIEQFHADQFGRFLGLLKSKQGSSGKRLLDEVNVVFGSGLGNANSHSNRNLPIIAAGGSFQHRQHMTLPKTRSTQVPACNLFTSILQNMGIEDEKFGTADGTLTDFTA